MPPLFGLTVDQAKQALEDSGLVLGAQTEEETQDPTQYGTIVSSTPESATEVPAGSAVAVVVGTQPGSSTDSTPAPQTSTPRRTTEPPKTTVAVPDVSGADADDAQRQLEQAGFAVKRTDVDGGNVGEAAGTEPAAGTQVAPKSTVTLRVFSGDSNRVDMPDVRGDRIEQAQAALATVGFSDIRVQLEATDDAGEVGRVLAQARHPRAAASPRTTRSRSSSDSVRRRRRQLAYRPPGRGRSDGVPRGATRPARFRSRAVRQSLPDNHH